MASVIGKLSGGREKLTLIGLNAENEKVEIEIDLTETFETTYNNQVTTHAIEKDKNLSVSKIADHVIPENPSISCNCVLSDNLNLLSTQKAISAKDKLRTLTYWQRSGSIITLEGYTVGSGLVGKILNFFNRGIGNFNSELEEPYYAGTVTEKIENLVLGTVVSRNKTDLGNDIEVTLNFTRVKIAEAMTTTKDSVKPKAGSTPTKKGETKTVKVEPKKDIKKSFVKGG